MNIDFNSKPTYVDEDKYIKTKIKTYEDNITTSFYNKKGSQEVPEEKIPHKYLSIIILILPFTHMKNITPKYFQKNVNMQREI